MEDPPEEPRDTHGGSVAITMTPDYARRALRKCYVTVHRGEHQWQWLCSVLTPEEGCLVLDSEKAALGTELEVVDKLTSWLDGTTEIQVS